MLGGPSALEQPSTSWGSTGAHHQVQAVQALPESPAIGTIPLYNQPSTSAYPHAAVTPSNSNKTDHCSQPSTSFATTPRLSSSASSEEPSAGEMTSSNSSPYRKLHFRIKLPLKKAQRLKRIASFQPQTLRRIGVDRLKVGKDGEAMTIADPPAPPPPPPPRAETAPRTEPTFDRIEQRPPMPGQPVQQAPPAQFAPHPGVPPEGQVPMPQRPQQLPNSSPLLVGLLSNQQPGREGAPPTNGPPSVHPSAAQRSFSPYQYGPGPAGQQHPVPGTPGVPPGMDPQMIAMQQQQQQERQRMMMMQQQHAAMQHPNAAMQHQMQVQAQQHAAAAAAAAAGHPGTPGCVPPQQPFFNPGPHQVRPQVPVNYPQGQPQHPQAMYQAQASQQRMVPPQYPPQGVNPQMVPGPGAPQFMQRAAEPEPAPSKKKRKPTKRQQQKEAEQLAAQNAAQQQFMVQQQGMMQPQQHMPHPAMPPMMGQNFPQGYPHPQYGMQYPPGATPQQQQMWQQHQIQQRMLYQQQQAQQQAQQAQQAAVQQAHNPHWQPQRAHVPYPPGTSMEGPPGSVLPVSQRPSSEFGADGASPITPHTYPQQQQQQQQQAMVNGGFMRHDSHGNLFNFAQSGAQSDQLDQFLSKDDSCELGDLDDIDIKPMADLGAVLPADLLDEASSSSSTAVKENAPSTPNGDRIDSSIASVVEMVSKSNSTQPTMTNVSQATAMTPNPNFRMQPQSGQFVNGPQFGIQPEPQRPPAAKVVKGENGGPMVNGHHQLPNGATKRSSTAGGEDDEQIGQYVKSLIVADEERRKAQDAGTKTKTQRKSRKKNDGSASGGTSLSTAIG